MRDLPILFRCIIARTSARSIKREPDTDKTRSVFLPRRRGIYGELLRAVRTGLLRRGRGVLPLPGCQRRSRSERGLGSIHRLPLPRIRVATGGDS